MNVIIHYYVSMQLVSLSLEEQQCRLHNTAFSRIQFALSLGQVPCYVIGGSIKAPMR